MLSVDLNNAGRTVYATNYWGEERICEDKLIDYLQLLLIDYLLTAIIN